MKPNAMIRYLLLCALAGSAACGSTAPSRFFALNALAEAPGTAASPLSVLVGPVSVADYLDRPQMVRRTSAQELTFDEYHRWAEPIDKALARVLAQDLAALLGSPHVVEFPARGQRPFDYRLELLATRFEEDSAGRAVFEARWTLIRGSAPDEAVTRLFHAERELSRRGDPAALAAALDESVGEFARQVADQLASR